MLLLVLLMLISFEGSALAYIDPGAGSYIVQVVIAAVVAGVFFIRSFFQRIFVFIRQLFLVREE